MFDHERQQVAAVSRARRNLDLFVIGNDSRVWTTFWGGIAFPSRLQFRLRGFAEHESTDSALQGASDEVYLSAIGADSAAVVVGPDGMPQIETLRAESIGDVSEDAVRGPWGGAPHVLMDFDFRRPSDWPRSFVVTLLIVEEDNERIAQTFDQLEAKVGKKVRDAAVAAATSVVGATVGGAIGSVIPGIGTVVGAGVGALAGFAYDGIIEEVKSGLGNEVFTPRPVEIQFSDPSEARQHPDVGKPQILEVKQFGAHYAIEYDWSLVD
ncbi:MAG: hypothetical protein ACM3ZF_17110 [Mycobacterium leprae]